MGFFSKLFEKKRCDLCGGEIGLLGNRKLEDGNCCKACASKLSPWFSERRESTVEEIRQQLAYREANRSAVRAFHETRSIGRDIKVLVDEPAGTFMVTRDHDREEENPDVLKLSQVTGCDLKIRESRTEVRRSVKDANGETKRVSYSPPRHKYSYDFALVIHVKHPYFDEIRFDLSEGKVEVRASPEGGGFFDSLFQEDNGPEGSVNPPTIEDRRNNYEYAKYEQMGKQIKEVLTRR